MTDRDPPENASDLTAEWPYPVAAALGASVRAKGIEREIKAELPFPDRKRLNVGDGGIYFHVSSDQVEQPAEASRIVEQ